MSRVQLLRCTRVERHNRLLTDSTKAEAGCWPAKPAVAEASAKGRRARQARKHSALVRIPARRKAGALGPGAFPSGNEPQPRAQGRAPSLKHEPVALAWPAAGDPRTVAANDKLRIESFQD